MTGTKTETGRCTATVFYGSSMKPHDCGEPIRKNQAGELEHYHRCGSCAELADAGGYTPLTIDRGHPALGLEEAEA